MVQSFIALTGQSHSAPYPPITVTNSWMEHRALSVNVSEKNWSETIGSRLSISLPWMRLYPLESTSLKGKV